MALDLYQRLGVKRGATEAEIKKAYRSLAKQLHPDSNKDNPNAAKRFGEITQAYDILSDKDKLARYEGRAEAATRSSPSRSRPTASTCAKRRTFGSNFR